ncbi:DUF1304 domain-containing protein [Janibacter sp. G1551]|uniref:DUF1304 domain-containing protein n=1 Tax=Janibacter sp. G1551 TaxID=3420440 RepID=UPI003D0380CD
MVLSAALFAALAALLHVYIFLMESFWWTRPAIWRRFGVGSQDQAEIIRPMAYNQGFYNLFLGIGALVGAVMLHSNVEVGRALILFGCGAMLAAALVLMSSGHRYLRAAMTQGMLPLIAVVLTLGI